MKRFGTKMFYTLLQMEEDVICEEIIKKANTYYECSNMRPYIDDIRKIIEMTKKINNNIERMYSTKRFGKKLFYTL